jgi:hypothetical protein
MSKAVLISIRPEWCEKIINGQKTIEVRKTRPKMNPPFKCYIYKCGNGKVIGEFLCDEISKITFGWHISNLKIYDTPRDLWEFTGLRETKFGAEPVPITRPPQSWRYVEEELWND